MGLIADDEEHESGNSGCEAHEKKCWMVSKASPSPKVCFLIGAEDLISASDYFLHFVAFASTCLYSPSTMPLVTASP